MNPAEGPGLDVNSPPAAAARPPAPAGRRAEADRLLVAVLLLIVVGVYAYPVYLMMRPVLDADVWWHLRTGQWIAEHQDVPRTDPFSAYGKGKDYVAYSWLYELTFYEAYRALGLTGLLLFRLALCGAVLVAIHRFVVSREPRVLWSTALTALAFVALTNVLYERTWMFSLLFSLLTLEAVLRLRDGTAGRAVWLLPVAFALWVNLHVQFVYGLVLLGLACAAPLADALLRRPTSGKWADTFGTPAWKRLVALTAACAAATLANPYLAHFYSVVLTYSSQSVPFQVENEFKSLSFRHYADWTFLGLALFGAAALGRRLARLSVFELLLFAGAAVLSFRARRDLWLLVFVSLALCTAGAAAAARLAPRLVFSWPRVAALAAAVAAIALVLGARRNLTERGLAAAVDANYPAAAVRHIKENHYAGPLFNEYNWGGYLIWALPEYPVSMDGRVHVHGDERLARHTNTVQGYDWDKDPELMTAGVVLLSNKDMANPDKVKPQKPLPSALRLHPHFRVAYEDDLAVVFVPRDETKPKEP